MKKISIICILLTSSIILLSCGKKEDQSSNNTGSPVTAISGGPVEPQSDPSKQATEINTVDVTTVSAQ